MDAAASILRTITVHEEVAGALGAGRPVVALETAVVTHGLPRRAVPGAWPEAVEADRSAPLNLELARRMEQAVRAAGAIPATVAVIDGRLRVGLEAPELERLASDAGAGKASASSLAPILAAGGVAGTTVAATLIACRRCPAGAMRVFATGGIGGVHRAWTERPDVSADLGELARTATCVVSAGAKSILDLPATLETLEALGVPVLGYRTSAFPRFLAAPDERLPLAHRVESPAEAAAVCRLRWSGLGQAGGVLLARPIDPDEAIDADALARATEQAEREVAAAGSAGADRTPAVLAAIATLTGDRTLRANLALLLANATLAARVAVSLREPA